MESLRKRAQLIGDGLQTRRQIFFRLPLPCLMVNCPQSLGKQGGVASLKENFRTAKPIKQIQKRCQVKDGRSVVSVPCLKSPVNDALNRHTFRPTKVSGDGENNHRDGAKSMGDVQKDGFSLAHHRSDPIKNLPQFLFRATFRNLNEFNLVSQPLPQHIAVGFFFLRLGKDLTTASTPLTFRRTVISCTGCHEHKHLFRLKDACERFWEKVRLAFPPLPAINDRLVFAFAEKRNCLQ
jgi:hypothetical protein